MAATADLQAPHVSDEPIDDVMGSSEEPVAPTDDMLPAIVESQPDNKPEATIKGAKIAVIGTIVAAIIGATAAITVALLQRSDAAAATSTTPRLPHRKMFDESALEGDDGGIPR